MSNDGNDQTKSIIAIEGMTLRDWLAGQALANNHTYDGADSTRVARYAYDVADAMLAARTVKVVKKE